MGVSRPLAERMDSRLVVPVAGGSRMSVDMYDMMGQVLATSGVWEPHVTAAFQRLLRPGDVCVDVGAHSGYYTLLAAKLVGPEGHVYALEPSAPAYEALRTNLALNGASNVTALRVAAGATDGTAFVGEPPRGNAGSASIRLDGQLDDIESAPNAVPVRTVDSVLEEADGERVRLVKIDVEGFEAEVLLGLDRLLERAPRLALVVEVHARAASDAAELLGRMSSTHGFVAYELERIPDRARFAAVPSPRAIPDLSMLVERTAHRTVNVLVMRRGASLATE
jgi:FkbM family methyltransferase